jgi:hypothetical protein
MKNLPKEVDKTVEAGVRDMVRDAKADAPVDMGALKGQITAKRNQEGGWSMVSGSSYSAYLEFGTKKRFQPIPGVDASQFKGNGGSEGGKGFYDNILAWVKRKGIAGTYSTGYLRYQKGVKKKGRRIGSALEKQIEDEQMAYAIYLSIIRHGIKPHPFFFKQLDKHAPLIIAQVNSVIQSVING